jgi:hypothetical protein
MESRRGKLIPCVVLAAVIALGVVILAPADLQVSCRVGGPLAGGQKCTFTNEGSLIPGKKCVKVTLTKSKQDDSPADPAMREARESLFGAEQPVGTNTESSSVCSGLVWGGSTKSVEIGYFSENPMRLCGGLDSCEMDIVNAD